MLSTERLLRWGIVSGLAVAVAASVLAYPFFSEALLSALGVRGVAGAGLALSAAPLLALAARGGATWTALAPALGLPAAFAIALASAEPRALRLVPACVNLGIALLFAQSLRGERSLVERAARWMVPEAPEFIAPYCRRVTALWALFFCASAAGIAALALFGSAAAWQSAAGAGLYAAMLGLSALEFLIRKTWFRYYFHGGPFDRFWSRLFPAEATEMGRRSEETIRRYREAHAAAARDARDLRG